MSTNRQSIESSVCRFIHVQRKLGRNAPDSVPMIINVDQLKAVSREDDGTTTFWIDDEKILTTTTFEEVTNYLKSHSATPEEADERPNSQGD